MKRRRTLVFSLALSVACTLGLYVYAWSINPRVLPISNIGYDDVGAMIRTEGHARSVESLGSGSLKIDLIDYGDFAAIPVFISGAAVASIPFVNEIIPGALIRVAGEVQEFRGMTEIAVSDGTKVELLSPASSNRLDLSTIALNPGTFSGMEVLVRGEVVDIVAIVDRDKVMISSGGERFWVDYPGTGVPKGEADVFGKVVYDEGRRRFEIKVAGESDGVLPHPSPVPANYSVVPLATLTADPEIWAGKLVAVIGAAALAGEPIGTSFSLADFTDQGRYSLSCMIFGWDWSTDRHGVDEGRVMEFLGIWGYYGEKAQWQVTSDEFSLRP